MARQRSEEAHDRVLRAALSLFGERGIDASSMDAITQASGVSKATIYNHWPNKEALLIDVMLMVNGMGRDPEDVDSGDVCRDLATVLSRRPPDEFDAARERMMPAMIAYSAVHQEFGEAWRHRVMEPSRVCLKRILRRAIKRGLLPGSLDFDAAMALLLGPLLYGHVFHKEAHKGPFDFGRVAAESFWRAYGLSGGGSKAGTARAWQRKKDDAN
ncbi:MAG: TetR/AcrR family transcriptional regulator [Terracidiphilus sp.]|jgi:AcrR family transcriptional regulator